MNIIAVIFFMFLSVSIEDQYRFPYNMLQCFCGWQLSQDVLDSRRKDDYCPQYEIDEMFRRFSVWYLMDDIRRQDNFFKHYTEESKKKEILKRLIRIKFLIGPENFWRGILPTPILHIQDFKEP